MKEDGKRGKGGGKKGGRKMERGREGKSEGKGGRERKRISVCNDISHYLVSEVGSERYVANAASIITEVSEFHCPHASLSLDNAGLKGKISTLQDRGSEEMSITTGLWTFIYVQSYNFLPS